MWDDEDGESEGENQEPEKFEKDSKMSGKSQEKMKLVIIWMKVAMTRPM